MSTHSQKSESPVAAGLSKTDIGHWSVPNRETDWGISMEHSFTNKATDFVAEEVYITRVLAAAIASESIVDIQNAGNAGEATVKAWRAARNAPQTAKTIRLAQRVPRIKEAIYNLIEAGDLNSRRERLFKMMFSSLVEIAASGDEIASRHARKVLDEFSAITAGGP